MSDDLDFPKANHALRVLRQARLSRNETAAIMVGISCMRWQAQACGPAREAAWIAISALASALSENAFAAPALWKAAVGATESWIELLD